MRWDTPTFLSLALCVIIASFNLSHFHMSEVYSHYHRHVSDPYYADAPFYFDFSSTSDEPDERYVDAPFYYSPHRATIGNLRSSTHRHHPPIQHGRRIVLPPSPTPPQHHRHRHQRSIPRIVTKDGAMETRKGI